MIIITITTIEVGSWSVRRLGLGPATRCNHLVMASWSMASWVHPWP